AVGADENDLIARDVVRELRETQLRPGAGGADLLPAGAVELPRVVFGFERFSVRAAMRSAEEDDAIANGVVRHREQLPRAGRVRRVDLAPVRAVPDPGVVEERDFAAERRLGVAAAEE